MKKFRKNYERFEHPGIVFPDPEKYPQEARTKQSFKDECDINNIMQRFKTTGILPDMIKQNPQYGDFSEVPDYQEALNVVNKAHEQFEALSSHVRDRFSNDPEKFLEFATDPKNREEMVKLGLAIRDESNAALIANTAALNAHTEAISKKRKKNSTDSPESDE